MPDNDRCAWRRGTLTKDVARGFRLNGVLRKGTTGNSVNGQANRGRCAIRMGGVTRVYTDGGIGFLCEWCIKGEHGRASN